MFLRCILGITCFAGFADAGVFKGRTDTVAIHPDRSSVKSETALVSSHAAQAHASVADKSTKRTWTVRLCNAFGFDGHVQVFLSSGHRSAMDFTSDGKNGEQRITDSSGPLPYKRCTDIPDISLRIGSTFKFRAGGEMDLGDFVIQSLPPHGSMLMIVLRRRDFWSTSADFTSHVFVDTVRPQIALVDAYVGKARTKLDLRDLPMSGNQTEQEIKAYGKVVEVAAGTYDLRLLDTSVPNRLTEKTTIEFVAEEGGKYTLIHVGTQAVGGQSFPDELTLWPNSGASIHQGPGMAPAKKGLFGIPSNILSMKSFRRSSAAGRTVSCTLIAVLFFVATSVMQQF